MLGNLHQVGITWGAFNARRPVTQQSSQQQGLAALVAIVADGTGPHGGALIIPISVARQRIVCLESCRRSSGDQQQRLPPRGESCALPAHD